ncbi:hypothetical protein JT31_06900 [Cedecea neteri]|uniref:Methyltransferase domain-containing protein n=1 Tax=Cedecea neteri TaxID=158822 RepID=A0A089RCR1_9ENTR|nr:class I SAM-dependent methyltransferase [Cedecea neteri]AIR04345.1 hypothetical protein JT31_06900 [Cedecea neteri]
MLNESKVKKFWDSRSALYNKLPFESIVNMEHDPELLKIKVQDETAKVFSWLPSLKGKSILDLGAGVGQWTFRFHAQGASRIVAVEYSEPLVEIGRLEAQSRQAENIEFIVSGAEDFRSNERFDVIFISGLFVYLNDRQVETLISNLKNVVHDDTIIMLRDGTGLAERYEINNQFSELLQTEYSALYRTAQEYKAVFKRVGFETLRDENMFPEGHVLNKYPETRLRLYYFGKCHG